MKSLLVLFCIPLMAQLSPNVCTSVSSNGGAYTCQVPPLTVYIKGTTVSWFPDVVSSSTTPTLDAGAGALVIKDGNGATLPIGAVISGGSYIALTDGLSWKLLNWVNPQISSGAIMFSLGSCPNGWAEVSVASGKYILATTNASGNVGTSGGSTSYTPTGTVSSPSFTGNVQNFGTITNLSLLGILGNAALNSPTSFTPSGTVSAPVFTGTSATIQQPFYRLIPCKLN